MTACLVKHGGENLLIWGCFAGSSVEDIYRVPGILNQHRYNSTLMFIEDIDQKRTTKVCKKTIC